MPVPEEVVGPHPRSKMRNAISAADRTCTNSTFVPCGNSGLALMSAAQLLPRPPMRAEVLRLHKQDKMRIPHIHHRTRDLARPPAGRWSAASPAELPCRSRSHSSYPPASITWHVRTPPCVPNATLSIPSLCASHAATHRVPLPESSASVPSELNSRRPISRPAFQELDPVRPNTRMPLAQASVPEQHVVPAACGSSMIRKSLPHACAFTNGIIIP